MAALLMKVTSLGFDSAENNLAFTQNSALIFEGSSVTLDFDSEKLSGAEIDLVSDESGNPLGSNTIVIHNDSNIPNPNPTDISQLQNELIVLRDDLINAN